MEKKTIYLHIGTPKTGTTSIQSYLAIHEEHLRQDGYLVPKSSRYNRKNHTLLSNYCLKKNHITQMNIRNGIDSIERLERFRADFYHDFREEIRQFEGSGVILSSEQCYENFLSIDDVKELKHLFEDLYDEIKIIVYIREQAEMLCSIYSTRMKGGKTYTMLSPRQFSRLGTFDFNQRLMLWEEVFGIENIVLRIFDKEVLVENDVVSDFCKAINIPRYAFAPIRLNLSLNAKQCEFLRLINEHIPVITEKKVNPIRQNIRKMIAGTEIESPPVTALISKEYQAIYNAGNKEVKSRYFENQKELFHKKLLNDYSLDQRSLLTEEDKKNLATQIIQNNIGEENITLLKCIAAIFGVEYENKKIHMDYVHSLQMINRRSLLGKLFQPFPILKTALEKYLGR